MLIILVSLVDYNWNKTVSHGAKRVFQSDKK